MGNRGLNHKKFHLWMAIFWGFFAVPTVLFWRNSIVLVLLISIYANFVGHISASEAANKETNCCVHCLKKDTKKKPHGV